MRVLSIALVLLAGCAAFELEADEPAVPSCCDDPELFGFPDDPDERARLEQAAATVAAHADRLGEIFDRACPAFDLGCLGELDRQLRPLAARTRDIREMLQMVRGERCGYIAEVYGLIEPRQPHRNLLIRLLRSGGSSTVAIREAIPFIAGLGRTYCCVSLYPR